MIRLVTADEAEAEGATMAEARGAAVPELARLRKRRALTQNELAVLAGVSRPVIIAGEQGRTISLPSVRKLAAALGVDPSVLMGEEE